MKFKSDIFGTVNGIRFYKAAANTGTHIGTAVDHRRDTARPVTFTNESAPGWQQANFSSPVIITPGTTYVAATAHPTATTRTPRPA